MFFPIFPAESQICLQTDRDTYHFVIKPFVSELFFYMVYMVLVSTCIHNRKWETDRKSLYSFLGGGPKTVLIMYKVSLDITKPSSIFSD